MGRLRVGFVLDDTLDSVDGVQQYILTLGQWMAAQGHEIHYLVGQTKRRDIANVHSLSRNLSVAYNGNNMSTPLPTSKFKIRKLLASIKLDVLHVQLPYSPFLTSRILREAHSTTAVVGTFHIAPDSASVVRGNILLGKILARSLRRFDSVVSVSAAAAALAHKAYGIESSVLPNVIRAASFENAKPYTKSTQIKTIVYLGRLVPRKGCGVLMKAAELLCKDPNVSPFNIIICGRGPLETDLKAYVRDNGLGAHVSFAGFVSDKDKARYLKSADVAVFPSTGGESFGIVLLEAMAAENPVVLGAANDGYKSVLSPFPELLFPVNDPRALADKLRIYLSDAEESRRALLWQKNYVRQFDVAVVGPRIIGRYQEALRNHTRT